jgi:hypothetical protein
MTCQMKRLWMQFDIIVEQRYCGFKGIRFILGLVIFPLRNSGVLSKILEKGAIEIIQARTNA